MLSTRRYPLRASQLERIRKYRAALPSVVTLAQLSEGPLLTPAQALAAGAVHVDGSPGSPESLWIPVEARRRAADAAKALEVERRMLHRYELKGLQRMAEGKWRCRMNVQFGPVLGKFEVELSAPTSTPTAHTAYRLLLEGRRRIRGDAERFEPVVAKCLASLDRLAARYPDTFKPEDAHRFMNNVMANRARTFAEIETSTLNYGERFVKGQWKAQLAERLNGTSAVLQVSTTKAAYDNLVVCLTMSLPGSKPRVTFRTKKAPLSQTVSQYLRGYREQLKTVPLVVQAEESLHGLLSAVEEIDFELGILKPPADEFCKAAVLRYKAEWEACLPKKLRCRNAARTCKPLRPSQVTVYTDASCAANKGGIASVLIGPASRQPLVVSAPTQGSSIDVLEARAIVLGFETLETYESTAPARVLTDNQSVAHAFRVYRETGLVPPVIRKALGNRKPEWMLSMLERHRLGWVKGHADVHGNVLADRAASVARASHAPRWL